MNKKGFTLLEFVLGLTVSILVITIVVSVSILVQKVWQDQYEKSYITARFIEISERLQAQTPNIYNESQLDLSNVPFHEELQIKPRGNSIIEVTLEKSAGRQTYRYKQYFKMGV